MPDRLTLHALQALMYNLGIRSPRHQGVSPPTNSPPRYHLATKQSLLATNNLIAVNHKPKSSTKRTQRSIIRSRPLNHQINDLRFTLCNHDSISIAAAHIINCIACKEPVRWRQSLPDPPPEQTSLEDSAMGPDLLTQHPLETTYNLVLEGTIRGKTKLVGVHLQNQKETAQRYESSNISGRRLLKLCSYVNDTAIRCSSPT